MLSRLLTSPVPEAAEPTHRAWMLFHLLWGLMAVYTVLGSVNFLLLPQNSLRWLTLILVVDSVGLACLVLNERQRTRLASHLLLWLLAALLLGIAWTAGGIRSPAVYFFPVLALIAGFLLGWRAALVAGLLCGLGDLGLVWADSAGFLPASAVRQTTASLCLAAILLLVFFLLLQIFAFRSIHQALQQAREELAHRRQAEEAGRAGEELRQRIFDSSPVPLALLDATTFQCVDCNPAAVRIHGFPTREEMLGRKLSDLSPAVQYDGAASFAKARVYLDQALADGTVIFEWRHQRSGGAVWDAEVHLLSFFSGQRRLLQYTAQDITERKQVEIALQESEEKFEKVFHVAPFLIAVIDLADSTYVDVNAEALRVSGFSREEVIGHEAVELGWITAADRARLLKELQDHGRICDLEMSFRAKDGHQVQGLVKGELISLKGRPCLLTVAVDLTERKQLEANFLRIQRMEGIGALAGGIAHDLNNILQPILMTVSFLRGTIRDPETREMLELMETCTRRGADIIKQLLTFARGKPGTRQPLPMRQLLGEVGNLLRETFPRNIQVRMKIPPELPSILGDATQIHQALINLCVNARDAMAEGGTLILAAETLTFDLTSTDMLPGAKPGPYLCLSVADSGTGIPPENLDRIFDPFFTTKEIGKGTGLGLATALGIVRGHGGFVRVNSRLGEGTVFEVYLPASLENGAEAPARRELLPPRADGELILVVDDEASVCGAIHRVVTAHGFRTLFASEGAEALRIFDRHRSEVRLVLTDLMMPGMDGTALVRVLRQQEPHLPILGMSGVGEKAAIKGLDALEGLPLLTKPFGKARLLNALHQALAANHGNQANRATPRAA